MKQIDCVTTKTIALRNVILPVWFDVFFHRNTIPKKIRCKLRLQCVALVGTQIHCFRFLLISDAAPTLFCKHLTPTNGCSCSTQRLKLRHLLHKMSLWAAFRWLAGTWRSTFFKIYKTFFLLWTWWSWWEQNIIVYVLCRWLFYYD